MICDGIILYFVGVRPCENILSYKWIKWILLHNNEDTFTLVGIEKVVATMYIIQGVGASKEMEAPVFFS